MPITSTHNSGPQSTGTPSPDERNAYRAFRQRQLETEYARWRLEERRSDSSRRLYGYEESPRRGLAYGRRIIKAFRESVASSVDELSAPQSPNADFARRALRIPDHVPVRLSWPSKIGLFLVTAFFPALALRLATGRLRSVGTPEGRELVFERLAGPACMKKPYYGEGLDFIARHFTAPRSQAVLDDLQYFDAVTARNAWHLGITTSEQLHAVFCGIWRSFPPEKLAVLIGMRVIRSVDELHWLEPWRERNEGHNWDVNWDDDGPKTIGRLLELGVPRQETLKVLGCWRRCDPARLDRTVRTLSARQHVDVAQLFAALDEWLWRAHPDNWDFVIDVIGAKDPQQWRLFTRILEEEKLPVEETVRELRTRGATLEELSGLQSLLLQMAERNRDPRRSIELLCSAPHSLGFGELAACRVYVTQRTDDDLADHLRTLAQYGFGMSAGVLAFQDLYANGTSARDLDRLLTMYRGLRNAAKQPEAVAAWMRNIGAKRINALEYLVSILPVSDRAAFDEIRPLAQIDRSLLEYAVEARGLRTVHALRAWRQKSRGIEHLAEVNWREPVPRLLVDDASSRGNFSFVGGNLGALGSAMWDERYRLLGSPIDVLDEEARHAYWQHWQTLEPGIHARILPGLRRQLDATGGMLATSLITAYLTGEHEYERQLVAFRLEVESLLKGQGPSTTTLSQLQADAIEAVYGVELREADSRWSGVAGLENHLDSLVRRDRYAMVWRRRPVVLKGRIDSGGLGAIRDAIEYGVTFRREAEGNVLNACQGLSPKQLGDPSASPQTFYRHLDVLLGVLDVEVTEALLNDVETLEAQTSDVDQRYAAAERMAAFFDIGLPDAIREQGTGIAGSLSDEAAGKLATRLAGSPGTDNRMLPRERMVAVLGDIADKVRGIHGAWTHRQLSAFEGRPSGRESEAEYVAFVSKHPAAYFAKVATRLCSANNVRMWREERQSHLVVFDPLTKRLVGMAMLYVERIEAIDPHRTTLVMRAINTVDGTDVRYDAESVVQSFLKVAQHIALDNNMAAVAFPSDDSGQHFMSNRDDIYKHVEKVHADAPQRRSLPRRDMTHDAAGFPAPPYSVALGGSEMFYGYEHGQGPVNTLYVMWQAPNPDALSDEAADAAARGDTTDRSSRSSS